MKLSSPLVRSLRPSLASGSQLSPSNLTSAHCDDGVNPLNNIIDQDPCKVAITLLRPCNSTDVHALIGSTACTCNLVFYNLISACCSLCLQTSDVSYSTWTSECTDSSNSRSYPFTTQIPGNQIPPWAYTNLTNSGNFDITAVLAASASKPSWTLIQKLAPVIAVVSALILGALLWFLWRRRRINRRNRPRNSAPRSHERLDSHTSLNTTTPLTNSESSSISGKVILSRAWLHLGAILGIKSFVRERRKDSSWVIDDDDDRDNRNHWGQDYLHLPAERHQERRRMRNQSSYLNSSNFLERTPRTTSSPWWNSALRKLGFVGRRTTLPRGSDYKISGVTALQRRDEFLIDDLDNEELLPGRLEVANGSPQASTSTRRSNLADRQVVEDISTAIISHAPDNHEAQEDLGLPSPPLEDHILPPLQPNRLGNVETSGLSANNIASQPPHTPDLTVVSSSGLLQPLPVSILSGSQSVATSPPNVSFEELDRLHPSRSDASLLFPAAVIAAGYTLPAPGSVGRQAAGTNHRVIDRVIDISRVEALPSRTGASSSTAGAGSSRIGAGPSRTGAGPSRTEAVPLRTGAGPSRTEAGSLRPEPSSSAHLPPPPTPPPTPPVPPPAASHSPVLPPYTRSGPGEGAGAGAGAGAGKVSRGRRNRQSDTLPPYSFPDPPQPGATQYHHQQHQNDPNLHTNNNNISNSRTTVESPSPVLSNLNSNIDESALWTTSTTVANSRIGPTSFAPSRSLPSLDDRTM